MEEAHYRRRTLHEPHRIRIDTDPNLSIPAELIQTPNLIQPNLIHKNIV